MKATNLTITGLLWGIASLASGQPLGTPIPPMPMKPMPKQTSGSTESISTCVDGPSCSSRCEAGDSTACTKLGTLYLGGQGGISIDCFRAASFAHRGCDGGDPRGCRIFEAAGRCLDIQRAHERIAARSDETPPQTPTAAPAAVTSRAGGASAKDSQVSLEEAKTWLLSRLPSSKFHDGESVTGAHHLRYLEYYSNYSFDQCRFVLSREGGYEELKDGEVVKDGIFPFPPGKLISDLTEYDAAATEVLTEDQAAARGFLEGPLIILHRKTGDRDDLVFTVWDYSLAVRLANAWRTIISSCKEPF
jgi:hypothetical protein